MSAVMQAVNDDEPVRLMPTPPSLDYHCAKCKKRIVWYEARVDLDTTKLHLTAKCHGEEVEFVLYLGMSGKLFG